MMEIHDSRCDECAYSQVVDMKGDPIWCRMHQNYFESSDECQDFSNNDYSALKHSIVGSITRMFTILYHTG